MADPSPLFPLLSTTLAYFNPAKSPFYIVVAAATFALCFVCHELHELFQWWVVGIPLFAILVAAVLLSFSASPTFDKAEHRDSLRFSRSMGISSALITLVLAIKKTDDFMPVFWICYGTCFCQAIIFLLYSYARSEIDESEAKAVKLNYVQFAFITTTLLIGTCYTLTQLADHYKVRISSTASLAEAEQELSKYGDAEESYQADNARSEVARLREQIKRSGPNILRHSVTGGALLLLWSGCMFYWANYLRKVIRISFAMPGAT